ADQSTNLGTVLHDVVAAHQSRAGRRRKQGGEDVDGGRLACAVRPEEPVDLSGGDGQVDPVDCPRALLVLADELAYLDPVGTVHACPATRAPDSRKLLESLAELLARDLTARESLREYRLGAIAAVPAARLAADDEVENGGDDTEPQKPEEREHEPPVLV